MTNESLNRYLHEKVLGLGCWHETVEDTEANNKHRRLFKCSKCSARHWAEDFRPEDNRTDYCSSLDAMAPVEAACIKAVGEEIYCDALTDQFEGFFTQVEVDEMSNAKAVCLLITAPALTRAKAVHAAMEGNDETVQS